MKYAVVPFFDYQQGNNDLLWKFFLLHAAKWIKYVDRLFVIDSGCNLEVPMNAPLGLDKITIIRKPAQSHWQNMNEALAPFTKEDYVLLLDSDMIIYDSSIVKFGFEQLEKDACDVMAILDSSGSAPIKSDLFKENENRFERRRICPYLCFIKKKVLREGFDFTPRGDDNWTDSMGVITEQLVEDGVTIWELQDDRSTISLEDDGTITSTQWLDTPPKKWAMKENPNLGYYHIRNFGGALKLMKDKSFGLVPGREARRLVAWFMMFAMKLQDKDLMVKFWETWGDGDNLTIYIKRFKEYHNWLEKI